MSAHRRFRPDSGPLSTRVPRQCTLVAAPFPALRSSTAASPLEGIGGRATQFSKGSNLCRGGPSYWRASIAKREVIGPLVQTFLQPRDAGLQHPDGVAMRLLKDKRFLLTLAVTLAVGVTFLAGSRFPALNEKASMGARSTSTRSPSSPSLRAHRTIRCGSGSGSRPSTGRRRTAKG